MKKIVVIFAMLGILAFSQGAFAYPYQVTLEDFTGDDAKVLLDIVGDGTPEITIGVRVLKPAEADLRAVFFDLKDIPEDLEITGGDVDTWVPGGDPLHAPGAAAADNGALGRPQVLRLAEDPDTDPRPRRLPHDYRELRVCRWSALARPGAAQRLAD